MIDGSLAKKILHQLVVIDGTEEFGVALETV